MLDVNIMLCKNTATWDLNTCVFEFSYFGFEMWNNKSDLMNVFSSYVRAM